MGGGPAEEASLRAHLRSFLVGGGAGFSVGFASCAAVVGSSGAGVGEVQVGGKVLGLVGGL